MGCTTSDTIAQLKQIEAQKLEQEQEVEKQNQQKQEQQLKEEEEMRQKMKYKSPFKMPNIQSCNNAFKSCDTLNTGKLRFEDMAELFNILNIPLNPTEVRTIIQFINKSNDGFINMKEFEHLIFVVMNQGLQDSNKLFFLCANDDYSGVITDVQLQGILKRMGLEVQIEGVQDLMYDVNKNREKMTYDEFLQLVKIVSQ